MESQQPVAIPRVIMAAPQPTPAVSRRSQRPRSCVRRQRTADPRAATSTQRLRAFRPAWQLEYWSEARGVEHIAAARHYDFSLACYAVVVRQQHQRRRAPTTSPTRQRGWRHARCRRLVDGELAARLPDARTAQITSRRSTALTQSWSPTTSQSRRPASRRTRSACSFLIRRERHLCHHNAAACRHRYQ